MDKADHMRSIVVPERVRLRTEQSSSQSRQWLKDLPGLIAELEHDNEDLLAAVGPLTLAHKYCELLASESGLDEAAIWEWGFIERVSTGLYICAYGSSEYGQPFFKTTQRLLDSAT